MCWTEPSIVPTNLTHVTPTCTCLGRSLLGGSAAGNSAINATSSVIKLTALIVVLPSTSQIKWISRL